MCHRNDRTFQHVLDTMEHLCDNKTNTNAKQSDLLELNHPYPQLSTPIKLNINCLLQKLQDMTASHFEPRDNSKDVPTNAPSLFNVITAKVPDDWDTRWFMATNGM